MRAIRLLPVSIAFCGLSLASCRSGTSSPRARPPTVVTAADVEVRDVPVEIRAPVDLRPIAQADVGSKTLGYLDAVLVDRGDRVKKGQPVALVRPSDLPDQLHAARGTLAQTQAAAALARANKERAEQLAPSGIVSEQDLQQATTALATTQAALEGAQANVGALAVRLGETRIDAPLDGIVSQRRLDPGALVGPSAVAGVILTIQQVDTLRIFVPVNENEMGGLQIGQDAHVELDALPGRSYTGKVVRISPSFDPLTRTLDAEVQIRNPGELRAGMYARGSIVTAVHHNALVVPAAAVQISNERHYVFQFEPNPPKPAAAVTAKPGARSSPNAGARREAVPGKVARVEVQVGVDGGDWFEVLSGLKAGDKIVTAGTDVLSDGAVVSAQLNVDPYTDTRVTTAIPPHSN